MTDKEIIADWKKKQFAPIYLLEGDEEYYLDKLIDYAEEHILTEEESSFNLTVFYGKEAEWPDVVNACKRYPMFADRQLVILKEAQAMKDLDKLEPYAKAPLGSTIFIIVHKYNTLDKRKSLYKALKGKASIFTSPKLKDYQLGKWISQTVAEKGFEIKPKSVALIEEHIGNDLSRISNEIDKLALNLKDKKVIDEDDIEKFIGINKEYNVFELQNALAAKDMQKALKIINYFAGNPKAGPIQWALPTIYSYVSKVYASFGQHGATEQNLKQNFYYAPAVEQAKVMIRNYGFEGLERLLLLLHTYNLRSIGVGDSGTASDKLLKEFCVKAMI